MNQTKDYTSTVLRMAGNIAAGLAPIYLERVRDYGVVPVVGERETNKALDNIAEMSVALAERILNGVAGARPDPKAH